MYGNKLHRVETENKGERDDYVIVPGGNRSSSHGKDSEAARIKEEWIKRNMQHASDGGVKQERRSQTILARFLAHTLLAAQNGDIGSVGCVTFRLWLLCL